MSNLIDLVKGIRLNRGKESEFISGALAQIKGEFVGSDATLKANALRKLSYVSFACFQGVNVILS